MGVCGSQCPTRRNGILAGIAGWGGESPQSLRGLWKLAVRRPKIVNVQRRRDGYRGDLDSAKYSRRELPWNEEFSMRGLRDKVAIVTGGGGGIGRAIVRRLADESVVVGVFDRDAPAADETVRIVRAAGGRAASQAVDITDYAAVQAAVREIEDQHGPTDILVNNAGWDQAGNFLDTSPSVWDKLIAINLTGPLNLHHIVLRGMVSRGGGRVVNISSDAARVGSSGEAVYAAAKAGVVAFTKTVARELASLRITLNVVCPGPTDTPLLAAFAGVGEQGNKLRAALERAIPFKRLGQPDDVAGIVAFLSSDEAGYITGQVISVSGGLTMHG